MSKVKIDELKNILLKSASKFVSKEEAEYFTTEQLETWLKKPIEGWIEQTIADLKKWEKLFVEREFKTVVDKKSSRLISCNGLPPNLKVKEIHDDLEKRAKEYGIAITGLFKLGGDDPCSFWTNGLAKRDLIGICMISGGNAYTVPYGGTEPVFGTNPFGYSIPTNGRPITGDFATSDLAAFRLNNAIKNGEEISPNSAVDENGNPTIDPKKAKSPDGKIRILPMGGNYKGYELVLLIEVLTGSLVQSTMTSMEKSSKFNPEEYGQLIIAIDISTFTDLNEFKTSTSKMSNFLRSQKPASIAKSVTVPGDRGYDLMDKNLKNGHLELSDELIQKLNNL